MSPRMTLDDVLTEMRGRGMALTKKSLSDCIKNGSFPFGKVIGVGPTGRTTFLIMRRDFAEWADKYLT